mmetsp:Transcript_5603/g.12206  ORF Transcript_5603/g.12206 Transcript_5603/m.12206 type:complete len:291 (+) Transcript_5603:981-1853(+)
MLSVGRAEVSAPQTTSRKSDSETEAFEAGSSFFGVTIFCVDLWASVVVGVEDILGGVNDSVVRENKFFKPSTQILSPSKVVCPTTSSTTSFTGSAFSPPNPKEEKKPPPLACFCCVFSTPCSISFAFASNLEILSSASAALSFPLPNPNAENNDFLTGCCCSTSSAILMASSASAITSSISPRKASLLLTTSRIFTLDASASVVFPSPPPLPKNPKNPPPPLVSPAPPALVSTAPVSSALSPLAARLSLLSRLSTLLFSLSTFLLALSTSTSGKDAVGFSHLLSPVTPLK